MKTQIAKRYPNQSEPYNEHKLYQSIYAACLSVRAPAGEADLTAKRVRDHITAWLKHRPEVTSHDIRIRATEHLHIHNPNAAYIYNHHAEI